MKNENCKLQNDGRATRVPSRPNLKFSIFIFHFSILIVAAAFAALLSPANAGEEFPLEIVRFQPYEKNPVFKGAGGDAWDAKIRERGWILRDGDAWRMWYTGYDASEKPQMMLGYATSPDG